jgi:hypothetical protein
MSSSEEDIPLVRANGRANGKPYPPCDAAAYTPFGSYCLRGHLSSHHITYSCIVVFSRLHLTFSLVIDNTYPRSH